jgi:O-antigen/teichoic acid export membrane protein
MRTSAAASVGSSGPDAALSSAVRRVGPLAVAGLIANGANLIVTVLIAHLLSTRGYGTLTQLIAMFLVLSMPGSALLVAVVRRIAAWNAQARGDAAARWIVTVRRRGAGLLAVWALVALAGRWPIAHLLNLHHADGVAEILIAGGGWALLSIERGVLQSRRAYTGLARNLCVEAGVRTVLTVGLVALGLGVEGAALAVLASMVAAISDARLTDKKAKTPETTTVGRDDPVRRDTRHLASDLVVALFALGLLAGLQNVDVLIVGHDAPNSSGPYGAISVASKAIVFGALVLVGYLLPEAVLQRHAGGHALRQLAIAVGLVVAPVLLLAAAAAVAPHLILRVAFGPDKTGGSGAFATLVLAMGALACSVLFTHYLLGIGRRRVVALLAIGAAALLASVAAAHGQIAATAHGELACQSVLAIVLGCTVLGATRRDARRPLPVSS